MTAPIRKPFDLRAFDRRVRGAWIIDVRGGRT